MTENSARKVKDTTSITRRPAADMEWKAGINRVNPAESMRITPVTNSRKMTMIAAKVGRPMPPMRAPSPTISAIGRSIRKKFRNTPASAMVVISTAISHGTTIDAREAIFLRSSDRTISSNSMKALFTSLAFLLKSCSIFTSFSATSFRRGLSFRIVISAGRSGVSLSFIARAVLAAMFFSILVSPRVDSIDGRAERKARSAASSRLMSEIALALVASSCVALSSFFRIGPVSRASCSVRLPIFSSR